MPLTVGPAVNVAIPPRWPGKRSRRRRLRFIGPHRECEGGAGSDGLLSGGALRDGTGGVHTRGNNCLNHKCCVGNVPTHRPNNQRFWSGVDKRVASRRTVLRPSTNGRQPTHVNVDVRRLRGPARRLLDAVRRLPEATTRLLGRGRLRACASGTRHRVAGAPALATLLGGGAAPFTWRATSPSQRNSGCRRR